MWKFKVWLPVPSSFQPPQHSGTCPAPKQGCEFIQDQDQHIRSQTAQQPVPREPQTRQLGPLAHTAVLQASLIWKSVVSWGHINCMHANVFK